MAVSSEARRLLQPDLRGDHAIGGPDIGGRSHFECHREQSPAERSLGNDWAKLGKTLVADWGYAVPLGEVTGHPHVSVLDAQPANGLTLADGPSAV